MLHLAVAALLALSLQLLGVLGLHVLRGLFDFREELVSGVRVVEHHQPESVQLTAVRGLHVAFLAGVSSRDNSARSRGPARRRSGWRRTVME